VMQGWGWPAFTLGALAQRAAKDSIRTNWPQRIPHSRLARVCVLQVLIRGAQ